MNFVFKLLLLLGLTSTSVMARNQYIVEDIYCSDFDQIYVGEVCQLTLNDSGKNLTLIVDLYDFIDLFKRDEVLSRQVSPQLSGLQKCDLKAYEEIRLDFSEDCYRVEYGDLMDVLGSLDAK